MCGHYRIGGDFIAAVDIEIKAVIIKSDLNKAMLEIQRSMHRIAGITGRDFSREFARNLDLDPARHINARGFEHEGARAGRNFSQGFNRAVDLRSPTLRVHLDTRSLVRDLTDVTRVATTAASSAAGVTSAFGDMTKAAGPLGTALKAVAGAGVVAMAADLGKALVTASQSLWLIPAAATAAAAGISTLMIGMTGFSDTIKNIRDADKFAESIQSLAPAAQQAALSIQALLPVWDGLVSATQQNLFAGVGQQINALANQFMPAVQNMTTGIATSFNQMFMGVTQTLSSNPELITGTLDNIRQAFENLAPAAAPFTKALAEIVNTGSSFLPQLATSVSEAAVSFSEFITNAAKTGDLQKWITDGINAAKSLASTVLDVGKVIYNAFGSAKPGEFKDTLDNIVTITSFIAGAINGVSQSWTDFSNGARTAANLVIDAMNGILGPLRAVVGVFNKLPGVRIDIAGLTSAFPHIGGGLTPAGGGGFSAPAPGTPTATGGVGSSAGLPGGPAGTPYPANGYAVPAPPPAKGANGGGPDVTVPYPSTDPNSLLQGYPATSSLYSSAQAVIKAQYDVAQQQAELDAVLKDNTATEAQIQKERNDVLKAQQDQHEAELRLNEAKAASTKKFTNATEEAVKGISDMGLDKDLGISKGIGGLVSNLFQGLATALTAPLQDMLGNIVKANPGEGTGITGILAAQGLFGDQYRPENINAAPQGYSPGYGPAGYGPTGMPGYGSNVDQAIGLAQSANGKPYTWGGADLTKGLADCSGAVSSLTAVITGQPQGQRLFNTESFPDYAANNGWQRGYAPGQFNVGVKHGGPGGGHMAATLPNGVPFESGSNGITYGQGQGALNPSFTEQWHLPVGGPAAAPTAAPYGPAAPLPTSIPGGGGSMAPGMPTGLPTPGYAPTQQPQAAPGWQPNGGGGGGGGLIGAAMSAATSAAGMFPGAGAAASIAQQAIQRTIQYGASSVGTMINGGLESLSVSDPDGGSGASLKDSWISKLAGSLVSASPSLPSTAGKADQQQQGQQQQQPQQGQQPQQPGGLTIGQFVQAPDRKSVGQTANDLMLATAQAGVR